MIENIIKFFYYVRQNKSLDHTLKKFDLYRDHEFIVEKPSKLVSDRDRFNLDAKNIIIEHVTSKSRAESIIKSKMMFGRDINQAAHFEIYNKHGNAVAAQGITMYFQWHGTQKCVPARHDEGIPNILFHVCSDWDREVQSDGSGHWESRVYPGTSKGLFLIGVYCSMSESYLRFKQPFEISIVTENEFRGNGFYFFDDE